MKYLKMLGLAAVAAMALMAITAGTASATTLEVGGVAQTESVAITATIKSGTSAILKDEFGTTTDTCLKSEVKGATETTFSAPSIGGKVGTLTFEECTHNTKVDANGSLSIAWTSGTNGEVKSSGAEVTVQSTFFGATALCKTGTGTKIGTATGVTAKQIEEKIEHATIDINAAVNCGILGTASWTGTYSVTTPTKLGVVS